MEAFPHIAISDVELYFDGACEDNTEGISQRFIDVLSDSQYSAFCTQYPECTIANVRVTCGETSRRRRNTRMNRAKILFAKNAETHNNRHRRTTDRLFLSFQLEIQLDTRSISTTEELYAASNRQSLDIITEFYYSVAAGAYNIDGFNADMGSFYFDGPLPKCLPGNMPAIDDSFSCSKSSCYF